MKNMISTIAIASFTLIASSSAFASPESDCPSAVYASSCSKASVKVQEVSTKVLDTLNRQSANMCPVTTIEAMCVVSDSTGLGVSSDYRDFFMGQPDIHLDYQTGDVSRFVSR